MAEAYAKNVTPRFEPIAQEAVRAVRLQRVADGSEPVLRRVAGTAREARDAIAFEGSRPGAGGGAARPDGSGGEGSRRPAFGPQGARRRRFREAGRDDEDVPGPVHERGGTRRVRGFVRMV